MEFYTYNHFKALSLLKSHRNPLLLFSSSFILKNLAKRTDRVALTRRLETRNNLPNIAYAIKNHQRFPSSHITTYSLPVISPLFANSVRSLIAPPIPPFLLCAILLAFPTSGSAACFFRSLILTTSNAFSLVACRWTFGTTLSSA
jgi:hypothetical protein